jgi:FlaA1/EpsC-like NDP-sugar epimerase
MAIAYCLSYLLILKINPAVNGSSHFDQTLLMVLGIQICIFWITGAYRETIRQMGLGSALVMIRTAFYAILGTAFILILSSRLPLTNSLQFLLLDFYLLLTLTLGFRLAYSAFVYWFNREKDSAKNILIYGANENGSTILHKICNSKTNPVKVLGFLDDDTDMAGKYINGYPVLGGYWKIEKINRKNRIDAIYLCKNKIKAENYRRMRVVAQNKGIDIKVLHIQLQDTSYQIGINEADNENHQMNHLTA